MRRESNQKNVTKQNKATSRPRAKHTETVRTRIKRALQQLKLGLRAKR